MAETIGVIAGIGRLPYAFTASAKRAGCSVVVIRAVPGAFEDVAESGADAVFDVFCGEWERLVQTLKAQGVGRVYLIGKIARDRLFGAGVFDERFRSILAGLGPRQNDEAVVEGFIADLAREGMSVGSQADYLSDLRVSPGVVAGKPPTPVQWQDILRGYEIAKALADLDVGQTVVVKEGAVLAVEAVDGTDATIARGLEIGRGGGVVVKVARPRQDPRFDVPTIGLQTLATVARGRGEVLAFDAHETFVLDVDECRSLAEREGISLVAYAPGMEEAGKA